MRRLLFLLFISVSCTVAAAEQLIELNDGTRLRGEVVSLSGGIYTIRSSSLGDVKVAQSRVVSISNGSATGGGVTPSANDAIQSIQSSIATNPGLVSKILRLQSDPEMQAVLSDPEVMRAVQSFDLEALSRNPKIQALMQNPTVREINSGLQ